jgi:hypothetical protein
MVNTRPINIGKQKYPQKIEISVNKLVYGFCGSVNGQKQFFHIC